VAVVLLPPLVVVLWCYCVVLCCCVVYFRGCWFFRHVITASLKMRYFETTVGREVGFYNTRNRFVIYFGSATHGSTAFYFSGYYSLSNRQIPSSQQGGVGIKPGQMLANVLLVREVSPPDNGCF
jgi:hypothetical protein